MILIAFVTGVLLGWLIQFFRDYGLKQTIESQRRAIQVLDHHLATLMNEYMKMARETKSGRQNVPPDVPLTPDGYWEMG